MNRTLQTIYAIGVFTLCFSAKAALLTYSFDGNGTAVSGVSGVSGTAPFDGGVSVTYVTSGGQNNTAGYLQTKSYNASATYWSFTLTTAAGYSGTLSDITTYIERESAPKLTTLFFAVYQGGTQISSSQGSLSLSAAGVGVIGTGWGTAQTLAFGTPVSLAANSTYEIRLWANGASGMTSDSLYFDTMSVNGSVAPVPEPANVALLVFACGATSAVAIRRFRKSKAE